MSEPNAEDFGKGNPVRLLHKIIAYVAIWIVALALTAPGLWALAWMFPLGLRRHRSSHCQRGRLGSTDWLLRRLSRPRLFLFPLEDNDANRHSLRRSRGLADRQRRGMPRHD